MSTVLPVAERVLAEQGKLRPFGCTLSTDDRIASVGDAALRAEFDRAALLAEFRGSFRDGAQRGELKGSALVYIAEANSSLEAPSATVCVELDHRQNYSIVVSFPYRFTVAEGLHIDEPFATEGKHEIFEG